MNIKINNMCSGEECLSVPKEDWKRAIKEEHFTLSVFCLYLFLADQKNGEIIRLDKNMYEEATGYKKTSFNDAIRVLKEKGYLIQKSENLFAFYTAPVRIDGAVPKYMFGEE